MCDDRCIVCEYLAHAGKTALKNVFQSRKYNYWSYGNSKEKVKRTSTPVPEENFSSESSDSVSDFFYESWKSGLELDDQSTSSGTLNEYSDEPYGFTQQVYYFPQYYIPPNGSTAYVSTYYIPVIGYRPDGTYGIMYWPYSTY